MTEHQTSSNQTGTAAPPLVRTAELGRLRTALTSMHHALLQTRYPLHLPTAGTAARESAALAAELTDYLIPRVRRLEAPPLAVVGGSTGVGKSTLVNSLMRSQVSPSGVLRPTTRTPVLVHHPADGAWFAPNDLLPWLARTDRSGQECEAESIQITASSAMPRGLALMDAPDVDSVVAANRKLSRRLLAAGDLWVFVTTAARYADAVPWALLRAARDRSTATALVLNRVSPGAASEIASSLGHLLIAQDLADVPLFVIHESRLDHWGLIPVDQITPLRDWLTSVAQTPEVCAAVVRQTVGGAIDLIEPTAIRLADAADEQATALRQLATAAADSHQAAIRAVHTAVQDGAVLRGEVFARWHDLICAGDLFWVVPTRVGRIPDQVEQLRDRGGWLRDQAALARDRLAWSRERMAAMVGRGGRVGRLERSLTTTLVSLLRAAAMDAHRHTMAAWRSWPAGQEIRVMPDEAGVATRALDVLDRWRTSITALVEAQAAKRPLGRTIGPRTAEISVTLVMTLACAHPAFPTEGALEAIFGEAEAVELIRAARQDLASRIAGFAIAEANRHHAALAAVGICETAGDLLRAGARETTIARLCAGLPAARMAPPQLPAGGTAPSMGHHVPRPQASPTEGFPWPASPTS